MPYRFDIYIGSDNGTRKLYPEYLQKVREWADSIFPDGYTLFRTQGCYRGKYEDSLLINALSDRRMIGNEKIEDLKRGLKQESILVVKSKVNAKLI